MEDDFGKTTPNIRLPKGEPEEDFGMTTPNMRIPKDEPDFGVTTPSMYLPKEEQDFGMTTPNMRMPQGEQDFGATVVNMPREEAVSQYQSDVAVPSQRPKTAAVQQEPQKKSSAAILIWVLVGAIGFLFIIAVGVVLAIVFWPRPGFKLIIQGAPANSRVFIDGNAERGTSTTTGEYILRDLRSGQRNVRITCEGYTDYNGSVRGNDGEEKVIQVTMVKTGGELPPPVGQLPKEIDHNGPMVLVDAGEFIMGSNDFNADEKPAHNVTLPAYYIDKFEVTNAQYKKFCDETGRTPPTDHFRIPGYFLDRPNDPVVGVSWEDAQAYAKWAQKRLPTEEEWEKAASWDAANKKKNIWPWGDKPDKGKANVEDVNGNNLFSVPGKFTGDVSPYGVFDMGGNVAEWVDSFYKAYEGNTEANSDFGETYKVVRGGTYKAKFADARTTRRFRHTAAYTDEEKLKSSWLIGFRCVVSANDPEVQKKINSPK